MPRLVGPALPAGTFSAMEQPRLENLRPWCATDVRVVVEAFSDPQIQHWHALRIEDEYEALDWVAQWRGRWEAEQAASWAVIGSDSEPVGQIGLRGIDLTAATAHLSYWVLPGARGRNVAVAAVAELEGWCFALGLHRLVIEHSTRNTGSCRVAEKAGYQLEGVLRSRWLQEDGRHDVHLHAKIRGNGPLAGQRIA